MKSKGWFGTVALAIIVGVFVGGVMHSTRVSASMKEVDNDSLNPSDAVVIEHNITLEATEPSTEATTTPNVIIGDKNENIVTTTPVVDDKVEPTEPSTTTQNPVQEKEESTNNENNTYHGCDHQWRCEYEPATETAAGYEKMDCVKCGETYIIATYPPTNN